MLRIKHFAQLRPVQLVRRIQRSPQAEVRRIVMSPPTTSNKVAIWVAVIGAVGLVVASLVPGAIPWIFSGHSKKYVSGTVSDASRTLTPVR
jgi:predicted phage tail protein